MFDTIQECVPGWNNSYIASNTRTENINDLLEYYGKLELQEAKRKPKTRRQDNSKSQQQPARNQNLRCQGNLNQRNGNNCHNEESFSPTISSAEIQMPNVVTLAIQKE
jgi:hypothetical protein